MPPKRFSVSVAAILVAAPAAHTSGSTVTFTLSSTLDGAVVDAGQTVDWSISITVSQGDNLGLAGVTVDLVQDQANPQRFDIPPADGVPAGMIGFAAPAGIGNPGGGPGAGYVGTQLGPVDERDLVQIGGMQNTFGVAGSTMGLDVTVDTGIGQLPGGQLIASGSFAAPAAAGSYTFNISHAAANTLQAVNPAPQYSATSPAAVIIADGDLEFTVCRKGDADGDFSLSLDGDVPAFVSAMLDTPGEGSYAACASDLDGDGDVDGADIPGFVAALLRP